MDERSLQLLRELAEWQPDGGVISVYLAIDPADRGGGWRIALENGLREVADEATDAHERAAVETAGKDILRRFPADEPPPPGRTHVGFVEAPDGRREWQAFQTEAQETQVLYGEAPFLAPLARLLDRGASVGVVLAAVESARAFEWSHGTLTELGSWELEVASLDWRERKAPVRNPQASGTGTTAAGRDQFEQRLEHNRERFLKQLGGVLADRFADREWARVLVFGEGEVPQHLAAGFDGRAEQVHQVQAALIRAPEAEVERQVAEEVGKLKTERQRALVARVGDAIGGEPGAALGPAEVGAVLEEGRVDQLLLDLSRDFAADGASAERMINLAVTTSAGITVVDDDEAAARLGEHGGVAALLRY